MEKKVEFKVGEDVLRGSLFTPEGDGPFPSVIFFHGSGSKGETYFELAKLLSENGILAFAFNFRGCGISDGKFGELTIGEGEDDARESLKLFLSQNNIDRNRLGICGSSYGGFLAALISLDYNFKSMILSVPASFPPSSMSLKQGTFISEILKTEGFEGSLSYERIKEFKGKLLMIKAENDEVIVPGMAEKYLEVANSASLKEEFILKDSSHHISGNPVVKKQLQDKIIEWFLKTL